MLSCTAWWVKPNNSMVFLIPYMNNIWFVPNTAVQMHTGNSSINQNSLIKAVKTPTLFSHTMISQWKSILLTLPADGQTLSITSALNKHTAITLLSWFLNDSRDWFGWTWHPPGAPHVGLLFFWLCNKIKYLLHMHISLYCSMNITANSVYAFYVIYNTIHKFVVSRISLKK